MESKEKMKIPKRFKLFGKTITVKINQKAMDDDDLRGQAKYRKDEIILQDSKLGRTSTQKDTEQTFYHELTHWIFHLMSERELDGNEKLVNTFSSLLHQALTTMEYD